MAYIKKTTKTQKKFEETLLKLMEAKKFEAITVNDITELADVNRSTFYRHYLDKYDLLEKIEDNILSEIIDFHSTFIGKLPFFKINTSFKLEDYITVDNNFFNIFEKHLATMAVLMGENGSITFQNKLNATMLSIFEKTFSVTSLKLIKMEKDLLYNFQASSFISILCYWTEHPQLTVQELFSFYSKIISNGIVNFVKEKMI